MNRAPRAAGLIRLIGRAIVEDFYAGRLPTLSTPSPRQKPTRCKPLHLAKVRK